jgi:hypothetical protein
LNDDEIGDNIGDRDAVDDDEAVKVGDGELLGKSFNSA